ncbi:MAG: hypothetical protein ACLRWQ_18755 [Flavonifractor plautii]
MVEEAKRTLAYLCPACRQSVAVERSVFQLAASANELPCPCGQTPLRAELMAPGEASPSLPRSVSAADWPHCHLPLPIASSPRHEKVLALLPAPPRGWTAASVGEEGPVKLPPSKRLEEVGGRA